MADETNHTEEEIAEDSEEDLEEEPRDWGKIGIAVLFFLIVIIGYYVLQAIF